MIKVISEKKLLNPLFILYDSFHAKKPLQDLKIVFPYICILLLFNFTLIK